MGRRSLPEGAKFNDAYFGFGNLLLMQLSKIKLFCVLLMPI